MVVGGSAGRGLILVLGGWVGDWVIKWLGGWVGATGWLGGWVEPIGTGHQNQQGPRGQGVPPRLENQQGVTARAKT